MSSEPAKSPRVAIIGGCQVVGFAAAARSLLPDADVHDWHVGVHPVITQEALAALLPDYDLVVSQMPDTDKQSPLATIRLREQGVRVLPLPVVTFCGFHPDSAYILNAGRIVPGVWSDYHSILVAASFLLGLPRERVPNLFNSLVFHELGYFQAFEDAKSAFIERWLSAGFDLAPFVEIWLAETGLFMYTMNHPHIRVLADLAKLALSDAGLVTPEAAWTIPLKDSLANHFVWPVYPELAKRIGILGSTGFMRPLRSLAADEPREVSLTAYITACYERYNSIERDSLRVPSISAATARLKEILVF
jgi:hypothetical protein